MGPQAEKGALIVHQVELHIAAPSDLLPIPLFRGIGQILPARNNGQIGLEKTVSHPAYKSVPGLQGMVRVPAAVVEEQSPQATGLPAVGVPKLRITFLLVGWVETGIVGVTHLFADAMEMPGILLEKIIRGKVLSPAEPTVQPVALFVVHLKIPPIGMYRGNHGTSGVQYQAEPTGEKIGLSHPKIRSEERRVGKECRSRWGRDAEIADGGKIARERVAG